LKTATQDSPLVRLGPVQSEEALKEAHACEFNITGRSMKGWILVALEVGSRSDRTGLSPGQPLGT
jgi:hypothetical protein